MRIIAGTLKNQNLYSPATQNVRPTSEQVRGAIFNRIETLIDMHSFLDLFAGSGAMGFEAISRGANLVYFIEKDKQAITTIKKNIEKLKVESCSTLFAHYSEQVAAKLIKQNKSFDVIFMDPPYDDFLAYKTLLELIDNSSLLSLGGWLIVEERSSKIAPPTILLNHLTLEDERVYGSTKVKWYQRRKEIEEHTMDSANNQDIKP